jgi:hypothetical protein
MKAFRPFFFILAFVLIVGLACNFGGGTGTEQPAATQQPPAQEQPTAVPPAQDQPTEIPPTDAPTEAPPPAQAPTSDKFFTEEFDSDIANWSTLTVTGSDEADPEKVTVKPENGKLVFDFGSKNVYYYLFYDPYTYSDVKIELRADNRGKNNNNVSLICRYDPREGWYEFNIANNGLYWIYFAQPNPNTNKTEYSRIYNGGSTAIKQGKDVNTYTATCKGDTLSLFINGKEARTVKDTKYKLREGKVGISVSSFNVLPILVEMEYFKISEP